MSGEFGRHPSEETLHQNNRQLRSELLSIEARATQYWLCQPAALLKHSGTAKPNSKNIADFILK
jgi:hypothetical protein